ncbi:putative ATP-grasp-modified RiPP, partial [Nonomuraea sp. NPDC048916]|uniref:putative ATP-grasp-modified RiPP n=1 Tax=Nonomuraea sp. NPDC048916 TaxID=3154232 RepID=UPI0033F82DEF
MSTDQTVRPWGLGRMTQLPPAAPEYDTITFDPGTQLTHFHDTHGAIVDMTKGTVTMSS